MDFAREPRRAADEPFSSDGAPRAENASQLAFLRSKSVLSKTGRFGRADRLLRTRDFTRVMKSGKRRSSAAFVVTVAERPVLSTTRSDGKSPHFGSATRRLGVTVSRRVGNAVIRNRVKRGIREWFRRARERLPEGSDTIVIARTAARDLSGCELKAALDGVIGGVGVPVASRSEVAAR